ncbi:MAG: type II secretion system GspH family protein [Lentisphaerales bacterium]|nr:type II secretion system GspH family protein [Lentisphaerales bacterium]
MCKFTLIELIVVIAMISILITILLPSIDKAREESMLAVCSSNLDQNYKMMFQGSTDNCGLLPRFRNDGFNNPAEPSYLDNDWAGVQNRKLLIS